MDATALPRLQTETVWASIPLCWLLIGATAVGRSRVMDLALPTASKSARTCGRISKGRQARPLLFLVESRMQRRT
ncbi:hypothetical protein IF1G_09179 [Cordyceps javanica]|uniref:Uncharacterized protein n=1 Tax=Cordyceps javanica TaxID=43265 RepID=A0A545URL0_9HYPO|nr:hypothetical protein IF1G_09179 [Cordyceps javanica]